MLVYYFVPFIVSNRYLLFWVSNGHDSITVQNWTHVYMNFFDHKDLGNHLLQLCPKVVKHPVFLALSFYLILLISLIGLSAYTRIFLLWYSCSVQRFWCLQIMRLSLFWAHLPSMPSSVLQVCENWIVGFILSADCLCSFVIVVNRIEACRVLYESHNCSCYHFGFWQYEMHFLRELKTLYDWAQLDHTHGRSSLN